MIYEAGTISCFCIKNDVVVVWNSCQLIFCQLINRVIISAVLVCAVGWQVSYFLSFSYVLFAKIFICKVTEALRQKVQYSPLKWSGVEVECGIKRKDSSKVPQLLYWSKSTELHSTTAYKRGRNYARWVQSYKMFELCLILIQDDDSRTSSMRVSGHSVPSGFSPLWVLGGADTGVLSLQFGCIGVTNWNSSYIGHICRPPLLCGGFAVSGLFFMDWNVSNVGPSCRFFFFPSTTCTWSFIWSVTWLIVPTSGSDCVSVSVKPWTSHCVFSRQKKVYC